MVEHSLGPKSQQLLTVLKFCFTSHLNISDIRLKWLQFTVANVYTQYCCK